MPTRRNAWHRLNTNGSEYFRYKNVIDIDKKKKKTNKTRHPETDSFLVSLRTQSLFVKKNCYLWLH